MALALARKYRPKTFADVAVQSHVSATLKGAIARGRVAHGYLLCGPRGVGKTTLARVLAMALNCERRADPLLDGEPCGECPTCQRIWAGSSSLDVVEIDAASNRGVDDARELRERAMYAPSGDGQYKVYIVDEAHMLTREAWNALLKILEEPPPRVVFVFATTEPQKIAQTAAPVLSRLQRFDFKRIGPADIRLRLEKVLGAEGVSAHPDALAMIARAADGSMRDALSLADQVLSMGDGAMTPDAVRDALGLVPEEEFLALLDLLAERRAGDVFEFVARLADAGIDFGQFLTGFADMVRAQLAVVLGGVPPEVSERARDGLVARRAAFAASDLLRMLQASTELEPRFRKSGQQQLLLESLLVRFALLDRTVSLEAVLRGLGGGGSGMRGGSESSAEPPVRRADAPVADWRTVVRDADRPLPGTPAPATAPPATAPPATKPATTKLAATQPEATQPAAVKPTATEPTATTALRALPGSVAPPAVESSATGSASDVPPDLNRLVERWDELVRAMRGTGKTVAATALEHASPITIDARGEVTIGLDEANLIYEQALESVKGELLSVLRQWFVGVHRVRVRAAQVAATPPARLTDAMARTERLTALRRRDAVLGAAIDALDLELAD
ncbi:MAG: DNA polymerase III subunit gamma/tau [Gemmatimonadaceae bacterium]|nr:DNA polymerase III subunit gamma/tau [Gemmatimonadaceae bacterium]